MKSQVKMFIGHFIVVVLTSALVAYLLFTPVQASVKKTKRCGMCHRPDPKVTISVEIEKQNNERIYYKVSGSTNSEEQGWGVFLGKKLIARGSGIGTFDLPADGYTYKVYWVDDKSASKIIYNLKCSFKPGVIK